MISSLEPKIGKSVSNSSLVYYIHFCTNVLKYISNYRLNNKADWALQFWLVISLREGQNQLGVRLVSSSCENLLAMETMTASMLMLWPLLCLKCIRLERVIKQTLQAHIKKLRVHLTMWVLYANCMMIHCVVHSPSGLYFVFHKFLWLIPSSQEISIFPFLAHTCLG